MKQALFALLTLIYMTAQSQSTGGQMAPSTYGQATNIPFVVIGSKPNDLKYMYRDNSRAGFRPFMSASEATTYLIGTQRYLGMTVIINEGGTLGSNGIIVGGNNVEYWFQNGTTDGALTKKVVIPAATTAPGATNQIIYNGGSGTFAASANFLWVPGSNTLQVSGSQTLSGDFTIGSLTGASVGMATVDANGKIGRTAMPTATTPAGPNNTLQRNNGGAFGASNITSDGTNAVIAGAVTFSQQATGGVRMATFDASGNIGNAAIPGAGSSYNVVSSSANGLAPSFSSASAIPDEVAMLSKSTGSDAAVWRQVFPRLTTPTLTGSTTNGVVTLSWPKVSGAYAYYIQQATDNTFTSPVDAYEDRAISTTINNLNGTYYFRMQPEGFERLKGVWSNTVSLTVVPTLASPSLSLANIAATSMTANWTSSPNAQFYTLQRSTDNFSTQENSVDVSGNTSNATGLTPNTLYYYRLQAKATGYQASPYAYAQAKTKVPIDWAYSSTSSNPYVDNNTAPNISFTGGQSGSLNIDHNATLSINFPQAAQDKYIVWRVPSYESIKTQMTNGALNTANIGDQYGVIRTPFTVGGYTYYVSMDPAGFGFDYTIPVILQ